ncbi:DNA-binding response regulator [Halomonas sp. DQ26W]|uniref:response regulator n=1 Tax=Halomonas sp. DQ26W TaxID=2282311 RepID=UPI000DF780E5|nr:response regulator transcription factor [Halomonas sp. DQ26W]RDB42429.1 DNA-binding response regulator [Halomonas sp. DQ26W]
MSVIIGATQHIAHRFEWGETRCDASGSEDSLDTDTALIRIVLADDHPLMREGIARSLSEAHGFEVVGEAEDATGAVDLVARHAPDLAVLDISMGGGGGLAAAADILAHYPATRVVLLTVSEEESDLNLALKLGVKGYILKGVTSRELRRALASVARGEAFVSPTLAAELLADATRSRHRREIDLDALTQREEQILKLLGDGLTNREIADRLCLAEKTVKHHMTNVLQKLQVRNRVEAALVSRQRYPSTSTRDHCVLQRV